MKKINIAQPNKCDVCHNNIIDEFYDTEYNDSGQPIIVCPACFTKGKCNNFIHFKNIEGFWNRLSKNDEKTN